MLGGDVVAEIFSQPNLFSACCMTLNPVTRHRVFQQSLFRSGQHYLPHALECETSVLTVKTMWD